MADKTALDMRYLNVPLPEDLVKLKWGGDYERLIRVIDRPAPGGNFAGRSRAGSP